MLCPICNCQTQMQPLPEVPFSVTSDNKIISQSVVVYECGFCGHVCKSPNAEVLNEIYASYCTDALLPHQEQIKFQEGQKPCSFQILSNTKDYLPPKVGKLLDIGAGAGGMLRSAQEFFDGVRVYALDVDTQREAHFANLESFVKMWTNLDEIDEVFEVVSLIHVLEHIAEAKSMLGSIKRLLGKSGVLLVQVPDASVNLWDVFVYDHCHHFSHQSLYHLLSSCGFEVVFPLKQIDRQITAICHLKGDGVNAAFSADWFDFERLFGNINLVLAHQNRPIDIFGTTTPSTFVGALLGSAGGGHF